MPRRHVPLTVHRRLNVNEIGCLQLTSLSTRLCKTNSLILPQALGEMGQGMVCGSNDFDGRGVEVESCSALILRNARCLHKESALLSFRSFRGATVSREHLVAHLEHSTGEQLVVCSVHLHVPAMIRKRLNYADYLLPLRHALENVAGQQTLEIPCLLLGDFNLDPADFHQLSIDDAFWKQLLGMRITLSVANVLPCCCIIFSSATFHLVPCDKSCWMFRK